jgi:para-nitrobenzyl esterase
MAARSLCLMFLMAALAPLAMAHDDDHGARGGRGNHSGVLRDTAFGPVVGVPDAHGTLAWKGVPFARPPVGALRWRPPVDPQPWKHPRSAREFGNACVQIGRLFSPGANNRFDPTIGATLGTPVGSEDCLYLNIWQPPRPPRGGGELPVIVFVHGGSNIVGYTADPVYDGAALARTAQAVVVTVNYRLGIFGFFNQPVLKTGRPLEDSGNFAMLDIRKALQFVQDNIRQFGGDPGNVTLMGQSAGAVNVYAMLTSPLVVNAPRQLFHRAVPLSGGLSLAQQLPAGSLATLAPASFFELQANVLLQQQLIVDGLAADAASAEAYIASQPPQRLAAYLRGKPAGTLLTTVLTRLTPFGIGGAGPIPEGTVLPVDPVGEIQAGRYLRVPVLAGTTREEAKLFPSLLALSPALGGVSGRLLTDAQVFDLQYSYRPDDPPQTAVTDWIPAAYLPVDTPVTGFNARTDLLNRFFFIASRDHILNAIRSQQNELWYFQFDWAQEPYPFNEIYGAAHAFELPFLFGNFGPSLFSRIANTTANRPGRLALSNAMMRSLGAFARRGDPNEPAALGVTWPLWPATLHFDATPEVKAISVTN